jgi:hypothetical protein
MQVLRRVVRDVFVPEHYPSSMARMFEWSPDECIPEFYCDSSVFESIHKEGFGLPDLELPSFAPTASEFIAYHRGVLESDEVSAQLHYWLDLTFGYCLDGQAAIDNMNVPLRHTLSSSERTGDSPKLDKHPGFVMLFNKPHPKRHAKNIIQDMDTVFCNPVLAAPTVLTPVASAACSHNPDKNTCGQFSDPSNWLFDSLDQLSRHEASEMNVSKSLQGFVDMGSNNAHNARQRGSISHSRYMAAAGNSFNSVITATGSTITDKNSIIGAGSMSSESFSLSSSASKTTSSFGISASTVPVGENRKSLARPLADSSLLFLQAAGSMDLSAGGTQSGVLGPTKVPFMAASLEQYKFAAEFGNLLEPAYRLDPIGEDRIGASEDWQSHGKTIGTWDRGFAEAVRNLPVNTSANEASTDKLRVHQANDMFAVGCLIAEIYNGKPLLSNRDTDGLTTGFSAERSKESIDKALHAVYRDSGSLPLVLRRVVSLLLQPDPLLRPGPADILQACSAADVDCWEDTDYEKQCFGGWESGVADFTSYRSSVKQPNASHGTRSSMKPTSVGPMVELLSDQCGSLFPNYFKGAYVIIGRIRLCRRDSSRLKVIVDSLDDLAKMPLEGLSLALPHLLSVLADPRPFKNHSSPSTGGYDAPTTPVSGREQEPEDPAAAAAAAQKEKDERQLENLLREYATTVDVLGLRLGLDGTEKLLVPAIMNFLNKLMSASSLQVLLDSPLWSILVLRSGVCCFLRHFLPALLTYVVAGTLQRVARNSLTLESGSPMWTNIVGAEHYEWLHACTLSDIRNVQMAAVASIINLSDPSALGHGLCARYVMPALLCLVSVPQLSAAGYGLSSARASMIEFKTKYGKRIISNEDAEAEETHRGNLTPTDRPFRRNSQDDTSCDSESDRGSEPALPLANYTLTIESKEDIENLDSFVSNKSQYDPQDMFAVRGIVGLCVILGEMVTSEVVLSKIFNSILPDLQKHMTTPLAAPVTAALMETVLLLNGVLPTLSPSVIIKSLLLPAKSSGLSLPKLLNLVPLSPAWCVTDDARTSLNATDLEAYIDYQRNHILHLELCRLVVSSSMIAGPAACEEYVLGSLDLFFSNFVETFGTIAIESRTMSRAFELGSELFLPLAQLVGPEAFYTTVSNLNPRLEMWLLSVGSGGVRTSPPLPPNILPEVVQTNSGASKERKKSIFSSLKSGFKSTFSSLSTSNTPLTPGSIGHSLGSSATKPSSVGNTSGNVASKGNVPSSGGRSASVDSFGESRSRALNFTPGGGISKLLHTHSDYNGSANANKPSGSLSAIYEPDNLTDDSSGFSPVADHGGKPPGPPSSAMGSPKLSGTELKPMSATKQPVVAPVHTEATPAVKLDLNKQPQETGPITEMPSQDDYDSDDDYDPEDIAHDLVRVRVHDHAISMRSMDGNAGNHAREEEGAVRKSTLKSVSLEFGIVADSSEHAVKQAASHGHDNHTHAKLPSVTEVSSSVQRSRSASGASSIPDHDHDEEDGEYEFDSSRRVSGDSGHQIHDLRVQQPSQTYRRLISAGVSSAQLVSKKKEKKQTKMASILSGKPTVSVAEEEEEEAKEISYNDHAWLLAGKGRWNIAREVRAKKTKELRDAVNRGGPDSAGASKRLAALAESFSVDSSWIPAAQVSMTAPRIAVDVAAEAVALFAFGMTSRTQWRIEESLPIRLMAVDTAETLLLTSSKSGVKIFALNTHPLKQVGHYNGHATAPFCAAFMRSGLYAATCDGSVHLWDIEHGKTLASLEPHSERGPYSFLEALSPRFGVTPTVNPYGDDQLLTCQGSALLHYDFRVHARNVLRPVSEWVMPPLPVTYSNFSSNAALPVHLTCAAANEQLMLAGSASGGLWAVDRRMGRVLSSWLAHDGPVVKVCYHINRKSFDVMPFPADQCFGREKLCIHCR